MSHLLQAIVTRYDDPSFWADILKATPCGSGGQFTLDGWFARLFRARPPDARLEGFAPHVSKVSYTDLGTGKRYILLAGLLSSSLVSNRLVPEFGQAVFEVTD